MKPVGDFERCIEVRIPLVLIIKIAINQIGDLLGLNLCYQAMSHKQIVSIGQPNRKNGVLAYKLILIDAD
jgi:hypothetical protein